MSVSGVISEGGGFCRYWLKLESMFCLLLSSLMFWSNASACSGVAGCMVFCIVGPSENLCLDVRLEVYFDGLMELWRGFTLYV